KLHKPRGSRVAPGCLLLTSTRRRRRSMTENASLSDYLFELRRGTAPARLGMAIGVGALFVVVGLFLGPRFAGLTGLGLAIAGVCAWARLNQIADSMMDGRFGAQQPART